MKTIKAKFESSSREYTFNTTEDVKVGDKLTTTGYKTPIEVTSIETMYVTHLHIGGKNIVIKVLDIIKIN